MAIFIEKEHKKTFFVGRGILDAPAVAQLPSLRRVWEAAPYAHLGILRTNNNHFTGKRNAYSCEKRNYSYP